MTKHNANANDNIHACVTLHDTDVNDNIYDCVALHDAYTTSTERERAFPLVCQRSVVSHHSHTHRGSSSICLRLSCHPHVYGHLCVLFTLILPFYFPALPSASFLLPPVPEVCGKPAQLRQTRVWTPPMSSPSPQVMSPRPTTSTRPQSSPKCSSWTPRRSSPTKFLLRTPTTMTLHSKTCSTKHIKRKPITLYEKTCLSVCRRRQCPIERSDPGRASEHRNPEAQIRTLLDNQKEQILAECQARINQHEFQAARAQEDQ